LGKYEAFLDIIQVNKIRLWTSFVCLFVFIFKDLGRLENRKDESTKTSARRQKIYTLKFGGFERFVHVVNLILES